MKFDDLIDESKAVKADSIANSSTPWKDRIIQYMTNLPADEAAQTHKQILEQTDDKYDETNYSKRKHCLASQFTYMRQDYNIRTLTVNEDKIVLVGIERDDKLIPFKNAVKFVK